METFLTSTLLVAIAEIGDKTQLLAIVLAARFKRPVPIILGVLIATLANHAFAATLGALAGDLLESAWLRYAIAAGFVAMALWALIPDKEEDAPVRAGGSAFLTTLVAFFLVEMGDKTQIATAALAARFDSIALVTAGTTLGMMLANIPAIYLGEAATRVLPLKLMRWIAAALFAGLGVWTLLAA
ncbi:MAG: TMEM165/GDT1 family protein [Hyphomonadaceae bacterium]